MAKKQKTQVEPTPQVVEQPKVETPVMEAPEPKARERKKPTNEWEIKDRLYTLKGGKKPLSRSIKSANIIVLMKKKVMKENLNIVKTKKHLL